MQPKLNTTEELLADFAQAKMVILVDDEARENEGDLVVAAECVTPDHINFMASEGKGLICLALTEQRCQQLELPLMVSRNSARFSTNFTVSIEAAAGVTTGISAQDRAVTIRAAVKPRARPADLVTPGHIFPIKAQPGGVMTRAGHTEAGVDLARLSGFEAASVICEILKPDGSMARLPDLLEYAKRHRLKLGSIADLIRYRMQSDPTVEIVSSGRLKLKQGEFDSYIYKDTVEGGVHLALVHGQLEPQAVIPVRVHLHRGVLDVLLQPQSASSWSLETALQAIANRPCGVLIMLDYDETPDELSTRIDLLNRRAPPRNVRTAAAANAASPANLRMLGAGGQILAHLGVRKVLALGREKRPHGLAGFGLEIVDYVAAPAELAQWQDTQPNATVNAINAP